MSGRTWRRALVTGGAGSVGSHLCARLLQAGTAVVCLDNLATGAHANVAELEQHRGFRFVRADATDADAVRGLPGRFDLVLHFACPASPADYLRLPLQTLDVGSTGTRNVLERARAAAVAGLGWAAGTAEFAWARIAPGPRTREEVTTMVVTSVLIPPAATWHRLTGLWRHRDAPAWREVAA
ncbi:SDR family NAD(P)-dependent oxidoreductase [Streptomyces kebangsaanensis]|uniref:SDR family NAD(P)-dependent oxidoreductase n=1 Tax=Streptomyces kebangsaanensis TaxID=864058 RepID=A0ABW6KXU4_9ACTN